MNDTVKAIETLVNMDTPSKCPDALHACAQVLKSWYEALGWQAELHDLGPETGPLLEVRNCSHRNYDAVLVGHYDTVFPMGTVKERPFRTEQGLAYGPGVADMKSGVVAMYFVAKNLCELGKNAPAVCMLMNPDEEIGSIYSTDKMRRITQQAKHIFVMEASKIDQCAVDRPERAGRHCHGRRGRFAFSAVFAGQSAHAGNMLERPGASAILEAANWTKKLCEMTDAAAGITVNVGVIEGGRAVNIVPDHACLRAEVRTDKAADLEQVKQRIEQMARHPEVNGVTIELRDFLFRPVFEANEKTMAYIDKARSIAGCLGQTFTTEHRGGVSDANTLCEGRDIVCLDGMGPCGGYAHSPEEFLVLSSVEQCIELTTQLLKKLS